MQLLSLGEAAAVARAEFGSRPRDSDRKHCSGGSPFAAMLKLLKREHPIPSSMEPCC